MDDDAWIEYGYDTWTRTRGLNSCQNERCSSFRDYRLSYTGDTLSPDIRT